MIICEWGWVGIPNVKRCPCEAHYVIKFDETRPLAMPFNDYNFVCEKHLKQLRRRKLKADIYELVEYHEKVEFT